MNLKQITALVCIAACGASYASEGKIYITGLKSLGSQAASSKNILEDLTLLNNLKTRIDDTNTWLEAQLKTHKSDTLSRVYDRIKYRAGSILTGLRDISANLTEIQSKPTVTTNFRKKALLFSQDRDQLKNDLQENGRLKKFKSHKKPMLRSEIREDAKQEIADVLIMYAETFVQVAQKAITDFARIDGTLYIDQQKPLKRQMPINANMYENKMSAFDKKEDTEPSSAESGNWTDYNFNYDVQ